MSTNWRISSFNGALLAAYFIPTWTIIAFRIMVSPIHGLYERPNISMALFVGDRLHLRPVADIGHDVDRLAADALDLRLDARQGVTDVGLLLGEPDR